MSAKLPKWLWIGGGILAALLLFMCVVFLVFSRTLSLGGAAATEEPYPGSDISRQAQTTDGLFAGEQAPGFGGGGEAFGAVDAAVPEAPAFAPTESSVTVANAGGQPGQPIQRLIIRNGSVSVSVANTYDARNQIIGLINQMEAQGAFLVSVNESGGGGDISPYISMQIRVPAAQFSATMGAIAKLAAEGTTPQRNETAQDVTAEYVDVKARVESMELARTRLQQIMAEAQNTTDLLQAEAQLTQREAEIEALKGQMQYLEQSAALSSITVSLSPYILSQPVDTTWQPGETVRRAFDDLLDSLRGFADFLIYFAVAALPWLIVAGLVIYGIVRFIIGLFRRNQRKQAAAQQEE